ncbi:helix-turn-helix domain-containing protein [Amycolatopsis sp. NPDC048633]|uniref:winged helix-turn-helix transcriptional regulator n=1 Tax=Amycolatopsis sp. NPDC048633 TaxID=3157095 RepID=UPI0033C8E621
MTRDCPIAGTLETVGDRWSLLALRELFMGVHRFEGIVANTGVARDVMTRRLRKLEDAGLLVRHRYSERPPRFEYHLTRAGHDLEPVLVTLRDWGSRHLPDPPATPVIVHSCGTPVAPSVLCPDCGEPLMGQLTVQHEQAG